MKRNPRFIFWLIILLVIVALFINFPSFSKTIHVAGKSKNITFDQNKILSKLNITKPLSFREGLDLSGGASITFKADMKNISSSQRDDALDGARTIIEQRVNLFGVSEPIVQTSKVNGEDRIIVEIPGITDVASAIKLIGTTAQLSFWESGPRLSATPSAQVLASLPYGLTQFLGNNPKKTNLSGSDLQSTAASFDPNNGSPVVQLNFTSDGTKKFADITSRNVGKPVAIVLDTYVISAPTVNQAILTGNAVITGNFTVDQTKALSTELNAGALPVPLSVLEQHVIGPSLGIDSLHKSLFAGIIGLITILIFMVVLYGRMGAVADLALLFYTLFVLAIFKVSSLTPYGITLTLAGIAGFILSIGMAVDANILIFERTREEMRAGKSKSLSVELGFQRAWTSIRDSNVSTLITSFILYSFGTGTVKGFALVLAIGVLVSMFSAITMTRTFLRVLNRD